MAYRESAFMLYALRLKGYFVLGNAKIYISGMW